ncbi:hypothetical protein ACHAP3_005898 [Botrytis cinerea]
MLSSTTKVSKYRQRILLSETIQAYGSDSMPCSNCSRYSRRCIVLNDRSQRCGECVRRGARCDVVQASVSDLESLRLEEERLQFERDTAFEAAMLGLARVRALELRQQELRERGREMLRRGLKSLDELDALEEKERLEKERIEKEKEMASASVAGPNDDSFAFDSSSLDPSLLASMDSPSFWANPGIAGGTPPTSQGS